MKNKIRKLTHFQNSRRRKIIVIVRIVKIWKMVTILLEISALLPITLDVLNRLKGRMPNWRKVVALKFSIETLATGAKLLCAISQYAAQLSTYKLHSAYSTVVWTSTQWIFFCWKKNEFLKENEFHIVLPWFSRFLPHPHQLFSSNFERCKIYWAATQWKYIKFCLPYVQIFILLKYTTNFFQTLFIRRNAAIVCEQSLILSNFKLWAKNRILLHFCEFCGIAFT